jgi:hypothetical protein
MVEDAPDCQGVYVLWRDGQPLGVGHALGAFDTIRSRLLAHLERTQGDLGITHYSWQICTDPLRREQELSRQFGLSARVPFPPQTDTNTNTTPCRHAESESSSSTT